MMKRLMVFAVIMLLIGVSSAFGAEYSVDTAHSDIGFTVAHMVISKVRGAFDNFTGSFNVDEKGKLTSAEAVIDVKSIDTRNGKRDADLRSANFFDVANYPTLKFKSTSVKVNADGSYTVKGNLSIRNVTKEVDLMGNITGPSKDPWGNTRIGFSARGLINRKDFGLLWNKTLETGGLLVGDEVTLSLEGEGVLKK